MTRRTLIASLIVTSRLLSSYTMSASFPGATMPVGVSGNAVTDIDVPSLTTTSAVAAEDAPSARRCPPTRRLGLSVRHRDGARHDEDALDGKGGSEERTIGRKPMARPRRQRWPTTITSIRVFAATPATPLRTRASLASLAAAAVGAGLLVVTVRQVGWQEIQAGLVAVGGWFALVLALGGVRFLARALAWQTCVTQVGGPGLPASAAFEAVIASDAVGNLTPLGLLASEPTKVLLVGRHVATGTALTSVALDNVFYSASVATVLTAGAWVLVRHAALPGSVRTGAEVVLVGAVVGLVVAAWVAVRRPALLSRLTVLTTRLTGRSARTADVLADIETRFYGVFAWPAPALWRITAMQALFHASAVAEVWMILSLLAGRSTSFADAFVLESTGRLITVLFKVVPFRVGVDEVGAAAVAGAIGVPISHGVSLALIRKLRILVWNAVGLVVLARSRR